MKTLILTEKPSVARDFASALGAKNKREGYIEGAGYIITWALGHLVELLEPERYDERWAKWSLESLPIIPDQFRYSPIKKTARQLEIIQDLIRSNELKQVVIATDAGREGEVIARTILNESQLSDQTELMRFWTSQALTGEVIKEGLSNLASAKSYDRLWHAGQARQIADWLVGMNGSRAATLKLRDLFSVGRVQTAVLALIVERQLQREDFTPQPFWHLKARFENEKGSWWGTWFDEESARFDSQRRADEVASRIDGQTGTVSSVSKRKKKQVPPPLYSLTDLQREANTKFGFSAKQTLDIAQNLYEQRKCLSYPRSDSQVLGSKNVDMVRNLLRRFSDNRLFSGVDQKLISSKNKRVFNDAKLTDHHALIPLSPLPQNASLDEERVFTLVLKRFAAAFHADCEFEQSEIITTVSQQSFRTKGKVILNPGWQIVYAGEKATPDSSDDDDQNELPPLRKGDPAKLAETSLQEKKTSPPARYTEALLLKDMTNPAKYVSESDLKRIYRGDVGLGTQATRAQIIETLLDRKYIMRQKRYLDATPKGCHLIATLKGFEVAGILASPEETARWEMRLEEISRGEAPGDQFIEDIKQFVRDTSAEFSNQPVAVYVEDAIGRCPLCGGQVAEGPKGYGCGNWREEDGQCRFTIWKTIAGREIDKQTAIRLLEDGRTEIIEGFMSRQQKEFSAALKVEDGKVVFDFNPPPRSFGNCPECSQPVIKGKRGYGCSGWKNGCRFVIWPDFLGYQLNEEDVQKLLKRETLKECQLQEPQSLVSLHLEKIGESWEITPV